MLQEQCEKSAECLVSPGGEPGSPKATFQKKKASIFNDDNIPPFIRPYKYKALRTVVKLKNGGPGSKVLLVFLAAPKTLILASPVLLTQFTSNVGVSGVTAIEMVVIPLAALVGIFTVVKNQVAEN